MILRSAILALLVGAAMPLSVRAWWEDGHVVVAKIAEAYLTPPARAGIKALLPERPISDVRICTWADLIRGSAEFGRKYPKHDMWHYINIELKMAEKDYKPADDKMHVVGAIARFEKVLADPKASADDRKEALMFLVHFVGDMHQPLHCGNRDDDRGGNLQPIKSFNGKSEGKLNLHKVWDGPMVQAARGELSVEDFAKRLSEEISERDREAWKAGDPTQWAWEIHRIVVERVYRFTDGQPLPRPDAPAADLTEENYIAANRPIVPLQLKKAGVRLAKVLNACFAERTEDELWEKGATLQIVAEGDVGGEGPAWDPELGILMSGKGHINRVDLTGKAKIYRKDAGTNGLLFDAQGRLLACEPEKRRITRQEKDGTLAVLTEKFDGKRYNQPNDITVDSQGRIYFSDPCYGDRAQLEMTDKEGKIVEGVYRIDTDGKVARIIGRELERPNGVLVSADDKYLFVADNNNNAKKGARKLYRFDLQKDGTVDIATRKLLYDWGEGRGPDGLKQDAKGRLYVAGGSNKPNPPFEPDGDKKGGIYVLDQDGKLLAFLPVPRDEVTNCAFGGNDLKTLYITGGGTLYSIRTATAGRVVWPSK